MPNQISKDKRPISLVLEKKLVAMVDNEAQAKGLTRTAVIVSAIREHLKLDPIPASASQIEEVKTALVQLVQEQHLLRGSFEQERNIAPSLPEPETGYKHVGLGFYRKVD